MTRIETTIKLKQAKTAAERTKAYLEHFKAQPYYLKAKKIAVIPPENFLDVFDGNPLS